MVLVVHFSSLKFLHQVAELFLRCAEWLVEAFDFAPKNAPNRVAQLALSNSRDSILDCLSPKSFNMPDERSSKPPKRVVYEL